MLRILVIDDNPADVALLRHGLDATKAVYELQVILDGESALKLIRQHWEAPLPNEPCVVVLDLHLPKVNGMAVLKAIRETPAWSHLKAAVITSGASPKQQHELLKQGIDLYKSKPRSLEEFLELGQQIVEICQDEEESVVTEVLVPA